MSQNHLYKNFMKFTVTLSEAMDVLTKDLEFDDITRVQFNILQHIALEQPITLSQISYCQNMSMPNTSREIRKLTEKGLVHKSVAENDRRINYITLTEVGTTIMNDVSDLMEARFSQSLTDASKEEIETLEVALKNMNQLLLKKILATKSK